MNSRDGLLYEQLAQGIKDYILQKQLKPGDRLPSIGALCEMFEVSHITVNSAFKLLRDEGVLESRRRSGVFVCDPALKSTFKGRRKTIALLIPYGDHPFEASIIRGVMESAQAAGYQVMMANNNDDPAREAVQLRALSAQAEGLLVMPVLSSSNYALFAELQDRKYPLVFVDRYINAINAPVVATDNEMGGYLLTRHLWEQGCRNVYLLGTGSASSTRERMDGYRRALREAGIPFDAGKVHVSTPQMDAELYQLTRQLLRGDLPQNDLPRLAGYNMMNRILAAHPRGVPFGVVAVTDDIAASAYVALRESGLNVPADVLLAGYDDLHPLPLGGPSLTSMRQYPQHMGAVAVDTLLKMLRSAGRASPGKRLMPEIVVRGSTAATNTAAGLEAMEDAAVEQYVS